MQKSIIAALILILAALAVGCGSSPPLEVKSLRNAQGPGNVEFTRVTYDELPQEIKGWVDATRGVSLAREKEFGRRRYILVTYGAHPTTGYTVEITRVESSGAKIYVTVKFTRPTDDQFVTTKTTKPYDIVYIEPSPLPMEFYPIGDEFHVPTEEEKGVL